MSIEFVIGAFLILHIPLGYLHMLPFGKDGAAALAGGIVGLLVSAVLGYFLVRDAVRINKRIKATKLSTL